jgi:aspartate/methionine/tyrosine aminotransferase
MQAIQIAFAAILGAGEECLLSSPAWPNAAAALGVAGAKAVFVPMSLTEAGWKLDIEQLFAAKTSRTRAIFLNSPSNPTGWTATREEMQAILEFARREGLWIIADEIYNRFYYAGARAPSFHDIISPDDRVMFVNTFSKNWSMTGWRLGWIEAPVQIGQVIENLIQYSTSGTPVFIQRAGVVALEQGEDYAKQVIERARTGREIVCSALQQSNRVRFAWPDGAFYLFFAIEGEPDVRRLGLRLVDEANIGIAPGTAFGAGGEGYMRLCFLRNPDQLNEASQRLLRWLQR